MIFFVHFTVGHIKAGDLVVAPPTGKTVAFKVSGVAFVDKDAGNASRSRVEVLVGTPAGEIDVPVVQLDRDISCRVSQVPSNNASLLGDRRCKHDTKKG